MPEMFFIFKECTLLHPHLCDFYSSLILKPAFPLDTTSSDGGNEALVPLYTMAPTTTRQWTIDGKDGFESLSFHESVKIPEMGDHDVLVKSMRYSAC